MRIFGKVIQTFRIPRRLLNYYRSRQYSNSHCRRPGSIKLQKNCINLRCFGTKSGDDDTIQKTLATLSIIREHAKQIEAFTDNMGEQTLSKNKKTTTTIPNASESGILNEYESKEESANWPNNESAIEKVETNAVTSTEDDINRYKTSNAFDVVAWDESKRHLLTPVPKSLEERLRELSISSVQLAFEMNMTNIKDALIMDARKRSMELLNPKDSSKNLSLRDPTVALATCLEMEPSLCEAMRRIPLHFNALIQGTVEIDASKISTIHLSELKVPEFNDYVTTLTANICSTALQKGFPADISRMSFSTKSGNPGSSGGKRNPHVVCVREGDKGCISPGNADLPKFIPKQESGSVKASSEQNTSLDVKSAKNCNESPETELLSSSAIIGDFSARGLMSCNVYAKAIEEATKRRKMFRRQKKGKSDDCKPCVPNKKKLKACTPPKEEPIKPALELQKGKDPCKTDDPYEPCKQKDPCEKSDPCKRKEPSFEKEKIKAPCNKPGACKPVNQDPCKTLPKGKCKFDSKNSTDNIAMKSESKKSCNIAVNSVKSEKSVTNTTRNEKTDPCKFEQKTSSMKNEQDPCKKAAGVSKLEKKDTCQSADDTLKSDEKTTSSDKKKNSCQFDTNDKTKSGGWGNTEGGIEICKKETYDPCRTDTPKKKNPCQSTKKAPSKKPKGPKKAADDDKSPCIHKKMDPCGSGRKERKKPVKEDPCKKWEEKERESTSLNESDKKVSASGSCKTEDPCTALQQEPKPTSDGKVNIKKPLINNMELPKCGGSSNSEELTSSRKPEKSSDCGSVASKPPKVPCGGDPCSAAKAATSKAKFATKKLERNEKLKSSVPKNSAKDVDDGSQMSGTKCGNPQKSNAKTKPNCPKKADSKSVPQKKAQSTCETPKKAGSICETSNKQPKKAESPECTSPKKTKSNCIPPKKASASNCEATKKAESMSEPPKKAGLECGSSDKERATCKPPQKAALKSKQPKKPESKGALPKKIDSTCESPNKSSSTCEPSKSISPCGLQKKKDTKCKTPEPKTVECKSDSTINIKQNCSNKGKGGSSPCTKKFSTLSITDGFEELLVSSKRYHTAAPVALLKKRFKEYSMGSIRYYSSKKEGKRDMAEITKCERSSLNLPKNRKASQKYKQKNCFPTEECPKRHCKSGKGSSCNNIGKENESPMSGRNLSTISITKNSNLKQIQQRKFGTNAVNRKQHDKNNEKRKNGDEEDNEEENICKNQVIRITAPCEVEKVFEEMPTFSEYDILVRIGSIALSGSDVHVYETGGHTCPGMTLGHDAAGVIEKVGRCVCNLKPGDRIVMESGLSCGICDLCKRGIYNMCSHLIYNGFLGKYQVHPADLCHKLPDSLSLEEAALTQTLALGCQACFKVPITPTTNVLVIGSCATAISAAFCARALGAKNICLVCTMFNSLELARKNFDFDYVHYENDSSMSEILESVFGVLRNWPNVVINCAVNEKTMNMAVMSLQTCGTCVLAACETECASFNALDVLMKNLRMISSFRSTNMFPTAIHLMQYGQAPMLELISRVFPWCQVDMAFRSAQHESNVGNKKIIVRCAEEENSN